jgi:hypothetical protein
MGNARRSSRFPTELYFINNDDSLLANFFYFVRVFSAYSIVTIITIVYQSESGFDFWIDSRYRKQSINEKKGQCY